MAMRVLSLYGRALMARLTITIVHRAAGAGEQARFPLGLFLFSPSSPVSTILFENLGVYSSRENFGKFGPLAGLSGAAKSSRKFCYFHRPLASPAYGSSRLLRFSCAT